MIRDLLKEPLLHFVLLGGAVFLLFYLADDTQKAPDLESITLSPSEVAAQVSQFEATWARSPTSEELQVLVEQSLRDEVLVREALALGLDQNDSVIRMRLRQKMEFFLTSMVEAETPNPETIDAYFADNSSRFALDARVAFSQVFLGLEPSNDVISETLDALEQGKDPNLVGQGSMLPSAMGLTDVAMVSRTFGQGFADTLTGLPQGKWAGPIPSAYGLHLVQLYEVELGKVPELSSVRGKVEDAWRADTRKDLLESQFQKLQGKYRIIFPEQISAGQK